MVAACTVICTCLAWVMWMLKAYLDQRRAVAREQQIRMELVARSTPLALRVASATLKGAPLLLRHARQGCCRLYIILDVN